MPRKRFSWGNYFVRLVAALVLVFATYNPEGLSYFHWVKNTWADGEVDAHLAFVVFSGVVLFIGWIIFLRATLVSLGAFGVVLAIAFFVTLVWVLVTYISIPDDSFRAIAYLVLFSVAGILSIGMSWSHVRKRFSGQLDVDETEL